MNWSSAQLAEATKKATGVAQAAPKQAASTTESPQASRVAQGQEKQPAFGEPGGPCTYLAGPYSVQQGGILHQQQLPDRSRVVVAGPHDERLAAYLAAAVLAFVASHPTRRDASGGDS